MSGIKSSGMIAETIAPATSSLSFAGTRGSTIRRALSKSRLGMTSNRLVIRLRRLDCDIAGLYRSVLIRVICVPMDILDRIRQRAASRPQHIVLPEGNDPRTVLAAAEATSQRLARITVLGDEQTIRSIAQDNRVDLGGVTIIDHKRAADFEKMVAFLHDLRRAKGLMADEARTLVSDPLYYGNLMVRSGL